MNTLYLILLSIISNIGIAILGVIPSVFITAFNVNTFGLFYGFIISLIGESLGAIVAFYLYRLGFKKVSQNLLDKHPYINKVINSSKKDQNKLVLYFRMFPYVPSGVVTYGAAISNMNILNFTIFSTIGKIPAMIIEVLLTAGFINALKAKNITLIFLFLSTALIVLIVIKIIKKGKDE